MCSKIQSDSFRSGFTLTKGIPIKATETGVSGLSGLASATFICLTNSLRASATLSKSPKSTKIVRLCATSKEVLRPFAYLNDRLAHRVANRKFVEDIRVVSGQISNDHFILNNMVDYVRSNQSRF